MNPMADQPLIQLREGLLRLHKALLNFEQKEYEGKYGRIPSPARLFELVTGNTSFAWLRALSELIVSLDELMDKNKAPDENQVSDLIKYTQKLLSGKQQGNEFEQKYLRAVQTDPAVALEHGRISQLLKK